MNGMAQQQDQQTVQIAGFIQNFKTVTTRTGKPMAIFTIGNIPVKCFDLTVSNAEAWASTGTKIVATGHFSNHQGKPELVAGGIAPVPPGKGHADVQTAFSQAGSADKSVQRQVSTRETSMITENLSGCVSNLKIVATQSRRLMITFKIGNASCKAFGELASAIQKTEGKQIEVTARKGGFLGGTEYAIETVKAIDGVLVDLRDGRTTTPGQHISKKVETQEAAKAKVPLDPELTVLEGKIGSLRDIPTSSGLRKAVFTIDGRPCKALGSHADGLLARYKDGDYTHAEGYVENGPYGAEFVASKGWRLDTNETKTQPTNEAGFYTGPPPVTENIPTKTLTSAVPYHRTESALEEFERLGREYREKQNRLSSPEPETMEVGV